MRIRPLTMTTITRTFVVAALVAACGNNTPAPAKAASGTAGGACDDATIKHAVDRGFAINDAYFAAVNRIRWTAACKDVETDLAAAVPAATKYSEDTSAFRRETMPGQPCGREIVDAINKDPRSEVVAKHFKTMLEASAPADERCREQIAGWPGLHDGVVGAIGGAY